MVRRACSGLPAQCGGGGMAEFRASTRVLSAISAFSSGIASSTALMPPTGSPEWAPRPRMRISRSMLPKQPAQIRGAAPPLKLSRWPSIKPCSAR